MLKKLIFIFVIAAILGCASDEIQKETTAYNIASVKTESGKEIFLGIVFRTPKNERIQTITITSEDHRIYHFVVK